LWDATAAGVASVPEADLRVMVLFSDGIDTASSSTQSAAKAAALREGVPVFAIGLGFADIFAMADLGFGSRGAFVYVPSGEQIVTAFDLVTSAVAESYVVEWETGAAFSQVTVGATLPDGLSLSGSTNAL
jgi:hypothetical protein